MWTGVASFLDVKWWRDNANHTTHRKWSKIKKTWNHINPHHIPLTSLARTLFVCDADRSSFINVKRRRHINPHHILGPNSCLHVMWTGVMKLSPHIIFDVIALTVVLWPKRLLLHFSLWALGALYEHRRKFNKNIVVFLRLFFFQIFFFTIISKDITFTSLFSFFLHLFWIYCKKFHRT